MRFTEPMPHNPWSQDMVIRVDDNPQHLTVLLFIRQAWGIAASADVPPLSPVPEGGASRLPAVPDRNEWEARWHRAWGRAWDWYAVQEPDPTVRPAPGYIREFSQPGRDLNPLIPPFWQAEYGWDGIDGDAYGDWQRRCSPPAHGQPRRKAADSPEPQSLPALVAAWKNGLDTVVVLPYAGFFARRITNRHLAVSAETRNDPASYTQALDSWTRPS
ncbi:hypothetical protein [Arthrobacter sp. Y81]|uniref:hypothetical protein n=1 Tax=Arthrobacter sp. Y81 TaxID=2058897 RepID=UPI001CA57637|nr:hypothetical protein [Arthrobacter sp. Y81]